MQQMVRSNLIVVKLASLELTVENGAAPIVRDKLWVAKLMASRAAISAANLVA